MLAGHNLTVPRRPPSNTGQVVEWLVWATLVAHSRLPVHLFLPLHDRGVDGILRRPADDAMVPLQVKGRTRPDSGSHIDLEIPDWSLDDPQVRWILTLLDPSGPSLAPNALLLDTASILRLGAPCAREDGAAAHRVACPVPPPPDSTWAPFACAVDELADRLLPPLAADAVAVTEDLAAPEAKAAMHWMGALAEVEVMRLLAGVPELNVFKSFPDVELSEYIARRSPDGAMRGIQVKCVGLDGPDDSGAFFIPARDMRQASAALIVVLAWRRDLQDFDELALLFPAARVPELCHRSEGRWVGVFAPRPSRSSRFAEVTVRRGEVGVLVGRDG